MRIFYNPDGEPLVVEQPEGEEDILNPDDVLMIWRNFYDPGPGSL